ncbi:MAG: hypothetical protein ACPH2K_02305 [Flavicella sp.]
MNIKEFFTKIHSVPDEIMDEYLSHWKEFSAPKNEQLDEEAVVSRAKLELPKEFSQQITNQFVAVGLYVYKDVSDIELKEYIEIWKTDIGKKYINMTFNSYKAVFEKMSTSLIKNLNNVF